MFALGRRPRLHIRLAHGTLAHGSLLLVLSMLVTGILTYVFHFAAARTLGVTEYGSVAALWSATFLTAQVLWIAPSHTLSRFVAKYRAEERDIGVVLGSVLRLQLLVGLCFLVVSVVFFPPLTRTVFAGHATLTVAFVLAVAFYGAAYYRRGALNGMLRQDLVGWMYLLESGSRLVVAIALSILGMGVLGVAAAIVVAPFLSAVTVRTRRDAVGAWPADHFPVLSAVGFGAPVLVSALGSQLLANGGPLLLSATARGGPSAAAGVLLAALTLTRTPQYVLSPVIAGMLAHFTRLASLGHTRDLQGMLLHGGRVFALTAVAATAGAWLFGSQAMQLLYGDDFIVSAGIVAALALTAVLFIASELLTQALFALGSPWRAAASWLAGSVSAVVLVILVQGSSLQIVTLALLAGTAVSAHLLAGTLVVSLRTAHQGAAAD